MTLYSEYLKVNRSFVPVYTQESDKENANAWMSFIPHQTLKTVVLDLIKALEGGQASDRRSLWIAGAYGTGKTYAAFVLKHLLEDDLTAAEQYFMKYPLMHDLWERFKALRSRKKNVLTIYTSSSGSIKGDAMLFMEIQRQVIEALRAKGYTYLGGASLRDLILEKITNGTLNFDVMFSRNIRLFEGVYEQAEEVRRALIEHPDDSILANNVLQLLLNERQYVDCRVHDIKDWLKDVIDKNKLDAIIFIWDEFTSYFKNNSSIDSLQEIVHAAQGATPFYFVLVTHRKLEQFTLLDADARKVLQNRFYIETLAMNEVTSYQLMANALEMDISKRQEWETKRVTLWDDVKPVLVEIRKGFPIQATDYKEEHFRSLVPLHPFAAFLLTNLSAQFSASHRTMFSFLRSTGGSEKKPDFQWFIGQAGPQSIWKWLTADYLWDYFFSAEDLELDTSVQECVAYYKNNVERLQNDELRVFKAAMLLLALEIKAAGISLLRSLKSNLDMIFRGTDLTPLRIDTILSQLEKQNLLQVSELGGQDKKISMPMLNIDTERIHKILLEKASEWSFTKNCAENGVIAAAVKSIRTIDSPNRFAERYLMRCATISNATTTLSNMAGDLKANQVGLLFMIQIEQADEAACQNFIQQKIADPHYNQIAFIHIKHPFGQENWKRWQEAKAYAQYAGEMRNSANTTVYNSRATQVINEWLEHVRIAQNSFSGRGNTKIVGDDVWRAADLFAGEIFPAGMEAITDNDNMYTTIITANSVKFGLGKNVGGMGRFDAFLRKMREKGIWESPDALAHMPHEPLARAREVLSQELNQAGARPIKLSDIWARLSEPPFGYMKVQLACVLLGYLFKEYIGKGYYLSDGHNTSVLSEDGISSAIENSLKNSNMFYSLSRMKAEHIFMCAQVSKLFNLPSEQASTLQDLRKNLRIKVVELRYPLWLGAFGQDIPQPRVKLLDGLTDFLYQEDENRQLQIADFIHGVIQNHPTVLEDARLAMRADNLSEAMSRYLEQKAPEAVEWLRKLNLNAQQIRDQFRNRIAQEGYWLWDRQKFEDEVASFEQEMILLRILAPLLPKPVSTISQFKQDILVRIGVLHTPAWLIDGEDMLHGSMIRRLYRFAKDQTNEDFQAMAQEYQQHVEGIESLLSDELVLLATYIQRRSQIQLTKEVLRNEVIAKLPDNCFEMEQNPYNLQLDQILSGIEASKKFAELQNLWVEVTGVERPSDLSQTLKLPIIWLPIFFGEDGRSLIALLDGKRPHDLGDIEAQLKWAQRNQENIRKQVADKALHEGIWLNDIIGAYIPMLQDVKLSEIQDELTKKFGQSIHGWSFKKEEIRKTVHELLRHVYRKSGLHMALMKIEQMDAETCKQYLKRLVQDNDFVGLAVLVNKE